MNSLNSKDLFDKTVRLMFMFPASKTLELCAYKMALPFKKSRKIYSNVEDTSHSYFDTSLCCLHIS